MKSRALYTALIGDYEPLNELSEIDFGRIDAFCFTDNPNLKSDTWKVIYVKPAFPADPVRSQRMLKILGHQILDRYKQTLYIDNSVQLLRDPGEILDEWLTDNLVAIPMHSFRESVVDEFNEVLLGKLDSRERITEQLEHYKLNYSELLIQRPYWNALIARENTEVTRKLFRKWADHVLRYSRRDQLSLPIASFETKVPIRAVEMDNYESEFHRWPIHQGRKQGIRQSSIPDYFEQVIELQSELQISRNQTQHFQEILTATWASFSWKITRPLRFLNFIRKQTSKSFKDS